jgi:asparagine synthase (glutamine-hydrolysing)
MCGIVGFQGTFEPSVLGRMSRSIAHRGPDSDGCVLLAPRGRGATGFAFRRLAIIDLSVEGNQPMTVRCPCCHAAGHEDLSLIFNGEIYNFRELRRELEACGHVFHSRTDSEVLLHLYAERGPSMLERLNGIFALALFDGRSSGDRDRMHPGDVLVARDQIGIKPLYYAEVAEGVLFASELKALLESPSVSRSLDPIAVHHTMTYLWSPAPRTMLTGVRKLPPGTAMLLRDGRVMRTWSYYTLPFGAPPLQDSDADVAEALHEELRSAVKRQMVADVPVGAFLSGGLDSSAVVAMMKLAYPDSRPRCYSIGFRGISEAEGNPPDLPYARRVADHLGVDLVPMQIEPDVVRRLPEVLYFLDEPQADPAPINALLIAEQARRDGIKVLLSGAGGDDIFSGYRRHQALQMERYWQWLPPAARHAISRAARYVEAGNSSLPVHIHGVRRAAKLLANIGGSPDERMVRYFQWNNEALRRSLYSPALADVLRDVDAGEPLLQTLKGTEGLDPLDRMLILETRHFLADHNLNYTDKMGMAAGVEVRVPLLDLELVKFAARIPTRMKLQRGTTKAIFKRAMLPDLPRDVIYRPKSGFGAPLRRWLRHELADQVRDVLSPASLQQRGLFDPTAVARLVARDTAGHVDGSYTMFAIMCVELWCRIFLNGQRP